MPGLQIEPGSPRHEKVKTNIFCVILTRHVLCPVKAGDGSNIKGMFCEAGRATTGNHGSSGARWGGKLDALAAHFSVSNMTIHRDLDDLEAAGILRKIRGGATIEAGTQFESDFRFREQQGSDAKGAMADAALALIEPGMTVIINDGSMAAVLGARLTERRPLTVVTNNAAVIDALKFETV